MERLYEILEGIRPDVDFKSEKKLMDEGILDSFDVVSIISEFNDEFGIEIRVNELGPSNFNSVEAMNTMVERLSKK
ncbi:MAG: phosphopantetheine-binding protein [Prolixibacteraceae bacterium]|jgi:acyl carrier protein|nr:phosphopantetheine-binding protein [Prolixibacteraceae bacterium]